MKIAIGDIVFLKDLNFDRIPGVVVVLRDSYFFPIVVHWLGVALYSKYCSSQELVTIDEV